MGRILKHLTSALEQSKGNFFNFETHVPFIHDNPETGTLALGDAGELSPNASVMLRIATLSAWAELAIASGVRGYLKDLIKPYRPSLASLWVASLRDYASVRADTEVLQEDTPTTLDVSYTNLGKEVLLPVRLHPFMLSAHSLFFSIIRPPGR
jgi:HEAT repeat-containing protein 5